MLEYDRIDISEGIDVNKTSASKECDIWYFGILKILVLRISHGFAMTVMILFMLKEVLTEFTFGHIPK